MSYDTKRECRCCRKPVPDDKLACFEHWIMLPVDLRTAISREFYARRWREFSKEVGKADAFWQARGIWKKGVPKSA